MPRPRDPNPSLAALRMRAVRERNRAGIKRLWLEADVATLRERLVETGRMTVEEFDDPDRLEEFLNELIDDTICSL